MMAPKITTLDELFSQEEAEREAKGRAEIAAERAAWDALPQAEKDRWRAEREAKWEAMEAAAEDDDGTDDEDEEEDEQDDEE